MNIKSFLVFIGVLSIINANAQSSIESPYPQDYFRNPLDIPIILAGNFGECRPNHFHSGLDIKTQGKENLAVHAAADGEIVRIRMQKGGFGHALYLRHPEGYTTVYAHLNNFKADVQTYMKAAQYRNKKWTVDLYPKAGTFKVKKGDIIAWSGNTGSSTAPHLHFEIRDSRTEHPLNPMLFGFDIKDNIAPVPTKVVVYDMDNSIYEQTPSFNRLLKKGSIYTTNDIITTTAPFIGIGIKTNDYMNDSRNTLTFYTAELFMDSTLQCKITLDDIGYDITRYMNAYLDYKTKKKGGGYIQLFFKLPGNKLNTIYTMNKNDGVITINDSTVHDMQVKLTDPKGNVSHVAFKIRYSGAVSELEHECQESFNASSDNKFNHPNVKFYLPQGAIYDNICFQFNEKEDSNSYSSRYQIHYPYIPLHKYFKLFIKPNKPIPFELRNKIAIIYNGDGKDEGEKAEFENGWYTTSTRMFGEYRLVADNTPPSIIPLQKEGAVLTNYSKIRFKATDAITSVKQFIAKLDGEWICFEQKDNVFFYIFDEHCPKGKHKLTVTAIDDNGNSKTITYNFTK
ncbi:MAG: M23 family metallopeptidase [Flavipsychrobacter sp.]